MKGREGVTALREYLLTMLKTVPNKHDHHAVKRPYRQNRYKDRKKTGHTNMLRLRMNDAYCIVLFLLVFVSSNIATTAEHSVGLSPSRGMTAISLSFKEPLTVASQQPVHPEGLRHRIPKRGFLE